MTNIVNLCPHTINFLDVNGNPVDVPASGNLARVTVTTVDTGKTYNGIRVTRTTYGKVEGLPERKDNTIYVVSFQVASRVPDREDVFIPSESIRDSDGNIIGCKSLGHV